LEWRDSVDIYQDIPSSDFEGVALEIKIGEKWRYQIQRQHGFMRSAVFTSQSARWASPILVDDEDNFEMLLTYGYEQIMSKHRPSKPSLRLLT
jgi:hypothetical protein